MVTFIFFDPKKLRNFFKNFWGHGLAPMGNLSNVTCHPRSKKGSKIKIFKNPLYIFEICQNWGHSQNFKSLGNFRKFFFYEAWFWQWVVWTRQHGRDNRLFWGAVSSQYGYSCMNIQDKGSLEGILQKTRHKKLILSILYINSSRGQICPPPHTERIRMQDSPLLISPRREPTI